MSQPDKYEGENFYPGVKLMLRAPGNSNSSLAENKHWEKRKKTEREEKLFRSLRQFSSSLSRIQHNKTPSESHIYFY